MKRKVKYKLKDRKVTPKDNILLQCKDIEDNINTLIKSYSKKELQDVSVELEESFQKLFKRFPDFEYHGFTAPYGNFYDLEIHFKHKDD